VFVNTCAKLLLPCLLCLAGVACLQRCCGTCSSSPQLLQLQLNLLVLPPVSVQLTTQRLQHRTQAARQQPPQPPRPAPAEGLEPAAGLARLLLLLLLQRPQLPLRPLQLR
jgi:hypothetical protein